MWGSREESVMCGDLGGISHVWGSREESVVCGDLGRLQLCVGI